MLHPAGRETKQIYLIRWLLVLGSILVLAITVALIANGRSSGIEGHPAQATETPVCPTETPSEIFPAETGPPSESFPMETPSMRFPAETGPPSESFPMETPSMRFPTETPSEAFPTETPSENFPTETLSQISPVCPAEPSIETSPEIPVERASAPPK
jgi:hypothetical protein